jgi:predicted transcriptional regulator
MSKPRITSQSVTEVIPSDSAFSEKYLRQTIEQKNIAARRQAIHEGIADANAGKLTCLVTVKAKWLSR